MVSRRSFFEGISAAAALTQLSKRSGQKTSADGSGNNLTLTFRISSGTERWTPPFPHVWADFADFSVTDIRFALAKLENAWDSAVDSDGKIDHTLANKVCQDLMGSMSSATLDAIWESLKKSSIGEKLREACDNVFLPIAITAIFEQLIEFGPHRVSGPRALFEVMATMLQPYADRQQDAGNYVVSTLCSALLEDL